MQNIKIQTWKHYRFINKFTQFIKKKKKRSMFPSEDQAHWNNMVQLVSKDTVREIQMVDSRVPLVHRTKGDVHISQIHK